jgi:predicted TIM-barrel fold metal-dependent hydrolase
MTSELAHFIQTAPLCDTHEHLSKEEEYVTQGPDLLQDLFGNYVTADLIVAGATQAAVDGLLDAANPDLRGRFEAIRGAWETVRHTGYGEAVRLIAREIYGMEEITGAALEAAQPKNVALRRPGERLRLLREVAKLDHVQVDDFEPRCQIDASGPDFFFYDISWAQFANGLPDLEPLARHTGVEVTDLASLRRAMEIVFVRNAPPAIAVKSQHAYTRTLRWQERSDGEAEAALAAYLREGEAFNQADRLCLGDWALARGVELAIEYDLPFKIHTGYYAGHSRMPADYIPAGHLSPLLAKYLDARFVLMHTAYPYTQELVALAKHYPNVYVDLCWAWSIDPFSTCDFVRRYIHAVPSNKLFVFGGDTFWPAAAVAYARQARRYLTHTLQAEIEDGFLDEREALALAARFLYENQFACFRLAEKKAQAAASVT